MRMALFLLLLLLGGTCGAIAAEQVLLAVIDRSTISGAELKQEQLALLAQSIRGEAARYLAGHGITVMSEENTVVILQEMGVDLASCLGECELETARRLQADWLIAGQCVRFDSQWTLQLNLLSTLSAALVSTEQLQVKSAENLATGATLATGRLLSRQWGPDSTSTARELALKKQAKRAATRTVTTPMPSLIPPPGPAGKTLTSEAGSPIAPRDSSTRCLGTTKAGAQCKLITKDPSGYCHHHFSQAPNGALPSPVSQQCQAITQKGTRCSRKAKDGGFCWQHSN